MTRAALLLVVAVLTSACGAIEVAPKATAFAPFTPPPGPSPAMTTSPFPTPAVAAAAPSATRAPALPVRAWDVPPRPGVAHLDAIVTAMVTGNAKALEPYLEAGTRTGSCTTVLNQGDLICPPGAVTGTQVRFIATSGGCEGIDLRVDPPGSPPAPGGTTIERLAQSIAGQPRFLWMATKSTAPNSYALYFLNTRGGGTLEEGWSFSVNATGITRFSSAKSGLCGLASQSELPTVIQQQSGATFLVAPPP